MADPYITLDVPPDADDETIRRKYLELARTYSPEHQPERFAAVRAAYDEIKNLDARVQYHLFGILKSDPIDSLIEEAACRIPRRRAGLQTLLKTILQPQK